MADQRPTPPTTSAPGSGWHFPPAHGSTMEDHSSNSSATRHSTSHQGWQAAAPNEHHSVSAPGWQPQAANASTSGGFAANSASPHWAPSQEVPPAAQYGHPPADPAVSSMESHWGPTPAPPSPGEWEGNEQMEDDAEFDDESMRSVDSGYDSMRSAVSSTAGSISESIFQFRQEYNRRYHAFKADESAYFLPNDQTEQDRMEFQHYIFLECQRGQLHLCPAGRDRPLNRVLDAGTGTGIWAMEFAERHPETAVVGVDLSPIQPEYVPVNVNFFVDDLEEEWRFETSFDFINMRMLTGSIRDWPCLMSQAFENLVPGGWLELSDPIMPITSDDGTLTEGCALRKWNENLVEALERLGASLGSAQHYKEQMIDAGFVDVIEIQYKWPIGIWPSDPEYQRIGYYMLHNMHTVIESSSLQPFNKVLGWPIEDIQALWAEARQDLNNPNIHSYFPMRVVYGRKPF